MARKLSFYLPFVVLLLLTGESNAALFGRLFGFRNSRCEPAPAGVSIVPQPLAEEGLAWYDDYAKAYAKAQSSGQLLLINFVPTEPNAHQQDLDRAILSRRDWQQKLRRFVLCRVPADARITIDSEPLGILDHAAFGEMHRQPGIAVVDLAHKGESYYGHVVSAFPFMQGKYYRWRTDHLAAILDLPPGTITQRTMIWAVRTHPERPESTNGVLDPTLAAAARRHSFHQASLGVQGHHNWDQRFDRLRGRLGGGLPVEVVAESWPGQTMIDSCVDCVWSWRQSPGHWGAVCAPQSRFGYDIRRGRNGIWYGTGIFLR